MTRGRFAEARARLDQLLRLEPMSAPARYLLGVIATEEGALEPAKEELKKALYLDTNFPLAHFQLANAYRNGAQPAEAVREYRNTLKLLARLDSLDIIPHSGGVNVMALAGICRNNLERLKA